MVRTPAIARCVALVGKMTIAMERVIQAVVRPDYRLWSEYSDRVEGEVDLRDWEGQDVFAPWLTPGVFEAVRVNERRR